MSNVNEEDMEEFDETDEGCFLKYFCAGQVKTSDSRQHEAHQELTTTNNATNNFITNHKQQIGIAVPMFVVNIVWWIYILSTDRLGLFTSHENGDDHPRWYMSITMFFGSMLAGATSEGGGAVAFPVMTLYFSISPSTARDFSLMIQSIGMVSASITILWLGILVEWKAIIYVSIGALFGIIFGLECLHLAPAYAKMYFAVVWAAFAFALYLLNRLPDRSIQLLLDPPDAPYIWKLGQLYQTSLFGFQLVINWKVFVLILTGFIGGILTSVSGTGVDISSFAVLTILFRISEKTATPTSVILMAINSVVGLIYREGFQGGVNRDAWGYWLVCVPIVCFGAPLGGLISSYLHRLVLAAFVYILTFAQLVSATVLIQPWKQQEGSVNSPTILTSTSIALFIGALSFFLVLQVLGNKLVDAINAIEQTKYFRYSTKEEFV